MAVDKSWMLVRNRRCEEFRNGLQSFISLARTCVREEDGLVRCPCTKCNNLEWRTIQEVEYHILSNGFIQGYDKWVYHGEVETEPMHAEEEERDEMAYVSDKLLSGSHDSYGDDSGYTDSDLEGFVDEYYEVIYREMDTKLYHGCSLSSLQFVLKLMHLKVYNKWSSESFDELLSLLKEVLPDGEKLPGSHHEIQEIFEDSETYRGMHQKKEVWVSEETRLNWTGMIRIRVAEMCEADGAGGGNECVSSTSPSIIAQSAPAAIKEKRITKNVLSPQRSYKKGVRRIVKKEALSSSGGSVANFSHTIQDDHAYAQVMERMKKTEAQVQQLKQSLAHIYPDLLSPSTEPCTSGDKIQD